MFIPDNMKITCNNVLILVTILAVTRCSSRSFNGREVDIKEVPFITLIITDTEVCTGFLVDVRWVITAGHCVENIKSIHVAVGRSDLANATRKFTTEKVIMHPYYEKYGSGSFDVALLKLKMSVKLSENTNLIQIDSKGWPNETIERRACYIIGYGRHRTLAHSGVLHGGQVTIGRGRFYDKDNCKGAWMLRAGYWTYYNESENLCYGDSGGPLVCDKIAVGVASAIYSCRLTAIDPCHEKGVDYFVSIYDVYPWIKSYITCLPKCNCYPISPSTIYIVLFVLICFCSDSLFY